MTAMTTFKVMTPIMTPSTEIMVMREMKVSRRRARKYLRPMKSSYRIWEISLRFSALRPKQRKKNNISNGCGIRKQHKQPIDTNPFTGGGRHTIFKSPNIIVIDKVNGLITSVSCLHLLEESLTLICRIVEL